MPLYDKPVRLLFQDMVRELGIRPGQVFDRDQVQAWFVQCYPKVKDGTISAHLIRLSTNATSRIHHNLRPDDDLFYQVDGSRFRLYDPQNDPAPVTKRATVAGPEPPDEFPEDPGNAAPSSSAFAYEKDLRNFLSKNLSAIEPGLRLYEEEGITGVEFPVGGRFIDILALGGNGNYVVVELKVSRGYDRVVGQLLRYMTWIEKHHGEAGQGVRGVIVAKEISEDLVLACSRISGLDLYEYSPYAVGVWYRAQIR